MKCNAIIVNITNRNTGKVSKYLSFFPDDAEYVKSYIAAQKPTLSAQLSQYNDKGELNICDGKVEPNIRAEEEPTWGGTTATLVVEFKCNKCGHNHYPGLPNDEDSLNAWLNKLMWNDI